MTCCVLIGPQGAGKSTCGALLAPRLNLPFVDTDLLIEAACGICYRQFWQQGVEPYRRVETEVIAALAGPAVVATGGGAVLRNSPTLQKLGPCIFLNRQGHQPERLPIYRRLAALEIDTGPLTPEETVEQIVEFYGQQ